MPELRSTVSRVLASTRKPQGLRSHCQQWLQSYCQQPSTWGRTAAAPPLPFARTTTFVTLLVVAVFVAVFRATFIAVFPPCLAAMTIIVGYKLITSRNQRHHHQPPSNSTPASTLPPGSAATSPPPSNQHQQPSASTSGPSAAKSAPSSAQHQQQQVVPPAASVLRQSDDTGGDHLRSDQLSTPPAVPSAQAAPPGGSAPSAAPSAQPQAPSPQQQQQKAARKVSAKASLVSPPNPPAAAAGGCGSKPQQQRQIAGPPKVRELQLKNKKVDSLQQEKKQLNQRLAQSEKEKKALEQHLAQKEQEKVQLENQLAAKDKAAQENSTRRAQLLGVVGQMTPLAIVGATTLSFKQAEVGETFSSYEIVGVGKGGSVYKSLYLDHKSNKAVPAAVKRVDDSEAWDMENGFIARGSHLEAVFTTLAAGACNDMPAALRFAGSSAAAGGSGLLGGGDCQGLVSSQELKLLPRNAKVGRQLQKYLNLKKARPASFESEKQELEWYKERDALAQGWLLRGNFRGEQRLVLVLPLAEGGSLDSHVAKKYGGFNCSLYGALKLEQFLFVAYYLAVQLRSFLNKGLCCRDIKSANLLVSNGLPRLADLDLGLCICIMRWALKTGYAAKDSSIGKWCGTPGYAIRKVAALMQATFTADEVANSAVTFATLAGADVGALFFTLLDILTGLLRCSQVDCSSPTNNCLLDGANSKACKFFPTSIKSILSLMDAKVLPAKVAECLQKGVRDGLPSCVRWACLEELIKALEEAMKQQAGERGISKEEFYKLQHQQLKEYFALN